MTMLISWSMSRHHAMVRRRCALSATKGLPSRALSTIASRRLRITRLMGTQINPNKAITRRATTSRSDSGDGVSLNARRIHSSCGDTTSSTRIAAPTNQLRNTSTRSSP
jgi:hypothetical protein